MQFIDEDIIDDVRSCMSMQRMDAIIEVSTQLVDEAE